MKQNNTCFFVGMHNKTGMQPLDSNTKTGKVIDSIIEGLNCKCIKTNLCNVDYLPKDKVNDFAMNWHFRFGVQKQDLLILLGGWVKKNFVPLDLNIIELTHPAAIFGTKNKEQYIKNSIKKINDKIDETNSINKRAVCKG